MANVPPGPPPPPSASNPPISANPLSPRPQLFREKRAARDGTKTLWIHKIQRGMVFWAEVRSKEARESEQNHDLLTPWLVVSRKEIHQRLPIVQAVPLTTQLHKDSGDYRNHRIRVLASEVINYDIQNPGAKPDKPLDAQDQLALTEQTRVMAHVRLAGDPIAILPPKALLAVEAGIRYVMGIP